jgi:hypothetical protein
MVQAFVSVDYSGMGAQGGHESDNLLHDGSVELAVLLANPLRPSGASAC